MRSVIYTFASRDHLRSYERLWDVINGKRAGCAWDDNPWVWRVAFKTSTDSEGSTK